MGEKLYRIPKLHWVLTTSGFHLWTALTPFGTVKVWVPYEGQFCWGGFGRDGSTFYRYCDSIEHGKALAQAWFKERMREGLEEVPTNPSPCFRCLGKREVILPWTEGFETVECPVCNNTGGS